MTVKKLDDLLAFDIPSAMRGPLYTFALQAKAALRELESENKELLDRCIELESLRNAHIEELERKIEDLESMNWNALPLGVREQIIKDAGKE